MKCLVISLVVLANMSIHLTFAAPGQEVLRWDAEQQAYTDLRERAVYTPAALGLTYQSYAYDAESDTWNLTHEVESPLLADK